ncbi:hypothetical protein, partial [Nostoc sp.]|uniref:hypothetical protein n=1 Tax=Nostoc sp. TaxID=1180 RepID=UPI002FF5A696
LIPKIIHTFAKSLTHSALLSHFAWLSLNSSNQLTGINRGVSLQPQMATYLQQNIVGNLSHPFYWAPFTMIGSPW